MDASQLPAYFSASGHEQAHLSVCVMLPPHPASLVSPKARLAGLCQAMGYARPPSYTVASGESGVGFKCSVCLYPPPDPHAELVLHCATLCNSKRDAELAAADQAMAILMRTPC